MAFDKCKICVFLATLADMIICMLLILVAVGGIAAPIIWTFWKIPH